MCVIMIVSESWSMIMVCLQVCAVCVCMLLFLLIDLTSAHSKVSMCLFVFFIWFNICSPESDIRHVWDSGFWYVINDFAILIKSVRVSMGVFEYSIRVGDDVFGDVK